MSQTLQTTLDKIDKIENISNRKILLEFDTYMIKSDKSERSRRNNLKYMFNYIQWLGYTLIKDVKNEQDI